MASWNSSENQEYQRQQYEIHLKKLDDRKQLIRKCIYQNDYIFPKELFTGIMFFEGEKITIEEFNEQVAIFRGDIVYL